MERLCNEVAQLIFYELPDPGPLALVSKRFHRLSRDPYVRARYFLFRYGPTEALFHAFARGRVLTESVLDILLASGARLSRYFIQVSIHHYFHTHPHFIKTPWVRNVSLRVFTYFLKIAEECYGDIPRGKGEDDGSTFSAFLKESKIPSGMRNIRWESIREILEAYNFIPFSSRDPIMTQFPLALAIEPKLLPYAVKNGFRMGSKYRDFVFRKIFENPGIGETTTEDITNTVRELCKLDPTVFVSRTVAAEVCMEAKSNETGYAALKSLDKSGELRFELHVLVEDLIKTFIRTRSISNAVSIEILRSLYTDFRSSDSTARLVILVTFFISSEDFENNTNATHAKLEMLGLTPISKKDVYNILVNPFVDRHHALLAYARWAVVDGKGRNGMEEGEIFTLVQRVASRCLELACKGRLLKKLCESYPSLRSVLQRLVLENHHLGLNNLPSRNDHEACHRFQAKLCQDFTKRPVSVESADYRIGGASDLEQVENQLRNEMEVVEYESEYYPKDSPSVGLGHITQETLTTMIRHDDVLPPRSRRRTHYPYGLYADSSGRLPYPPDPLPVARWIKTEFGARSRITAIFMTHAVINDNTNILHHYTHYNDGSSNSTVAHVPVTLKHFELLARLGRAPNFYLYHAIESGAEFYSDENDYLEKDIDKKMNPVIEPGAYHLGALSCSTASEFSSSPTSCPRTRKRPRRTVTAIQSYAVPDSDDEIIADLDIVASRPRLVAETSLQKWLRHLGELAKEEQRKYKEEKKEAELAYADTGTKVRVGKNEFYKSLSSHLRNLRRTEMEKRLKLLGSAAKVDGYSDEDDGDVEYKTKMAKRRKGS